jgi:hypothetical protein
MQAGTKIQWSSAFGDVASGKSFSEIFSNVTQHVVKNGGVIKFDLTGFSMKGIASDIGLSAEKASSYTNWEFLQIVGNKKLLEATKFYENGAVLPTEKVILKFADSIKKGS